MLRSRIRCPKSGSFKGVGAGGFDIYENKFEGGAIDWRRPLKLVDLANLDGLD